MIIELLPPDTRRAFEALCALRPRFADVDAFVGQVDEVQRPQGYRVVAAFEDGAGANGQAVAAAGFRVGDNLGWGRYLYVDDLSTVPAGRGRGHAHALLEWLVEEGERQRCDQLHLDSGVGTDRLDAHRLYLNSGFRISSHHFARDL